MSYLDLAQVPPRGLSPRRMAIADIGERRLLVLRAEVALIALRGAK